MKELGLIFRTIFRNKTSAFLVAVQLAITLTVVVNEYTAVTSQLERASRDSGMASENNLFTIRSVGFATEFNPQNTIQEDLLLIRGTSGVVSAYATNTIPMSGSGVSSTISTSTTDTSIHVNGAIYLVDEFAMQTLGSNLLFGNNFTPSDVLTEDGVPSKIIVSQELAESLFPDTKPQDVVGTIVYYPGGTPQTIVGIIDKLHSPWQDDFSVYKSMLHPKIPQSSAVNYLVRTEPSGLKQVMQSVEEKLAASNTSRIVHRPTSISELRKDTYRGSMVFIWVLSVTMATLIVIAGCGIVGLASFTVQRSQILLRTISLNMGSLP